MVAGSFLSTCCLLLWCLGLALGVFLEQRMWIPSLVPPLGPHHKVSLLMPSCGSWIVKSHDLTLSDCVDPNYFYPILFFSGSYTCISCMEYIFFLSHSFFFSYCRSKFIYLSHLYAMNLHKKIFTLYWVHWKRQQKMNIVVSLLEGKSIYVKLVS